MTYREDPRYSLQKSVRRIAVPSMLGAGIRRRLRLETERKARLPIQWMIAAAAMLGLAIGLPYALKRAAISREDVALSTGAMQLLQIGFDEHIHCKHGKEYKFRPDSVQKLTARLGPEFADFLQSVHRAQPLATVLQAHECAFHDRKFIHVVLEEHGKTISALVMPKRQGDWEINRPVQTTKNGLTAVLFDGKRTAAYVVSELGATDSVRLASSMEPALRRYAERVNA